MLKKYKKLQKNIVEWKVGCNASSCISSENVCENLKMEKITCKKMHFRVC